MPAIDRYLRDLVAKKGSDLHLTAGRPPLARVHGELAPLEPTTLDAARLAAMLDEIAGDAGRAAFASGDHDFAYAVPGLGRFRVNLFVQERGPGAVLRLIPEQIVSLEELKAPAVLSRLADLTQGLVLVTGPTGSGKSTTTAAIIDAINQRHVRHVLTIEDPLEFVHARKKSVFSHREIGLHARTFASALKAAMREDPDVLLVGELRDRETIGLALEAAEMGILVFGTLHTSSAAKTIARVVDAFPEDEQPQARSLLAESLAAIVAQLLLRTADRTGRVAVHEILLRSPSLSNLIRESNAAGISNLIQAGKQSGMQTLDDALFAAVKDGHLAPADAYEVASDKKRFNALLPPAER